MCFPFAPHHLPRASKRGNPAKSTQTAWDLGCCLQLQGCQQIPGTHLCFLQAGNIACSSTRYGDSSPSPELQPGSLGASGLAHTDHSLMLQSLLRLRKVCTFDKTLVLSTGFAATEEIPLWQSWHPSEMTRSGVMSRAPHSSHSSTSPCFGQHWHYRVSPEGERQPKR